MTRVLHAIAEARRTVDALTDHALTWFANRHCTCHCTHRQTHSCGKDGR
jgi:hypothetical protein